MIASVTGYIDKCVQDEPCDPQEGYRSSCAHKTDEQQCGCQPGARLPHQPEKRSDRRKACEPLPPGASIFGALHGQFHRKFIRPYHHAVTPDWAEGAVNANSSMRRSGLLATHRTISRK